MAWRDLVQHNFWWKLTAVILAGLIWLTVDKEKRGGSASKSGEATRRFEGVSVQLLLEPGIATTLSVSPKTVHLVARGQSGELELLAAEDFTVYARVDSRSHKTNGRSPLRAVAPEGIHVDEILPSEISFDHGADLAPKPHPSD